MLSRLYSLYSTVRGSGRSRYYCDPTSPIHREYEVLYTGFEDHEATDERTVVPL